jgi:hypothetical protein
MTFHRPTQWQLIPKGTNLLGHYVIPPGMDKLKGIIPRKRHETKENSMHIFKCFENQSDTYHDTQNHYLMEQDSLLLQNQADGMDVVDVDR